MISVILLVYNGEEYLRQCLDSVVNQTAGMENIELIAFNDVSTDSSGDILKEYQKKWPDNIRIVNREVNSVSAGESNRNLGVEMASGNYILFLDQDDWYRLDAFKRLEELMDQNKELDFIEYSFNYTDKDGHVFQEQHVQEEGVHLYSVKDENKRIDYVKHGLLPSLTFVWSKIYRKSFLETNHLKENGMSFADNFFSGLVNLYCTSFGKCDEAFYNYRNYMGSGSHKKELNDESVFKRCRIGLAFYEECKRRDLLQKQHIFVGFIFTNTFFVKPFWRLLFMFEPIPYEYLREMRKTMKCLYPYIRDNEIVQSKKYMLELVTLLDEEWTDVFLQEVYKKRQRMYEDNGTQFDTFLGR